MRPKIDILALTRAMSTAFYPQCPEKQDEILRGDHDYEFDVYYATLGAREMLRFLVDNKLVTANIEIVDNGPEGAYFKRLKD